MNDENAPIYSPGALTTTDGINDRRPYQPTPSTYTFGTINIYDPANNSGYNRSAGHLRGQVGRKLNLLTSYVWSKDLNYSAPFVDGSDIRKNRGLSDLDVRNRFTLSAVYRLPEVKRFGKGGDLLLNGWQLNSLATLSSGSPYTVTSGKDSNLDGFANDRTDLIGNPYSYGNSSRADKIAHFLNPSAFVTGTGPCGTARRNALIGPGNVNTNLSLFKIISLHESLNLQLRGEVFNVFGNVNLTTRLPC